MVTIRNYIPGEHLNWSHEEIGWDTKLFDPATVWIVFVDGSMEGMLIGAQMLNTLFLIRLLGGKRKAFWARPLWKVVCSACVARNIAGFWVVMDNHREPERKILKLLQEGRGGSSALFVKPTEGIWVAGRF